MESFYGGPRSASFQLVKSYNSKTEMIEDFGTDNCPVGYGEYVIINNNTSEHGDVYRRDNSITVDNGAVYICNIAGPQGRHAEISIIDFNDITGQTLELNLDNGLVSGKNYDAIKIKEDTVLNVNNNTTVTRLGLQIPYPVIEFETKTSSIASDFSIIKKETDNENPFYSKYELIMPSSVMDQSFLKTIQQKTVTMDDNIYNLDGTLISNDYVGKTVLTYTVSKQGNLKEYLISTINTLQNISYDTDNNNINFNYGNEIVTVPIRILETLNLNDDGSLVAKYSDSDTEIIINEDNYLKWIDSISYDADTQSLIIHYNTPNETATIPFSVEKTFNYVSSVTKDVNNDLVVKRWDIDSQSFISETLSTKSLTGITINTNGKIVYTYSDNTNSDGETIKLIKDISYNEENKQIQISYNTGEIDSFLVSPKSIKSIRQDNANMIITYDNDETKTLNNVFSIIQNFNLNKTTGELVVQINNENISLGTISYINEIVYDNQTGYLQYSYQNSNEYVNITKIKQIQRVWIEDNNLKVEYNTSTEPETLGEVEINQILDIELFLDTSTISNVLDYLRETYPNGYQNNSNYCIAAGDQNKKIYGYGYYQTLDENNQPIISATKDWHLIGDYSNGPTAVAAKTAIDSAVQNLPLGGIWFQLEEKN